MPPDEKNLTDVNMDFSAALHLQQPHYKDLAANCQTLFAIQLVSTPGTDTRGRHEGRPYPWSQLVIHEISGLGLFQKNSKQAKAFQKLW
jgi:hypothetical protein